MLPIIFCLRLILRIRNLQVSVPNGPPASLSDMMEFFSSGNRSLLLQNGSMHINVECYKFLATNKNQVHVLQQNSSGWHAQKTTAYCLTNTKMDISPYVQDCVHLSLNEACRRRHPAAFFFRLAQLYRKVSNLPVL